MLGSPEILLPDKKHAAEIPGIIFKRKDYLSDKSVTELPSVLHTHTHTHTHTQTSTHTHTHTHTDKHTHTRT